MKWEQDRALEWNQRLCPPPPPCPWIAVFSGPGTIRVATAQLSNGPDPVKCWPFQDKIRRLQRANTMGSGPGAYVQFHLNPGLKWFIVLALCTEVNFTLPAVPTPTRFGPLKGQGPLLFSDSSLLLPVLRKFPKWLCSVYRQDVEVHRYFMYCKVFQEGPWLRLQSKDLTADFGTEEVFSQCWLEYV